MRQADVVDLLAAAWWACRWAWRLAQGGLKTVVADAAPAAAVLDPEFDGRVSALAYASVRMLRALGVWEGLAAHAQPIREILVTDGKPGQPASPFSLHFDAAEVGADGAGPYRREPPHPRRAVCGGGRARQSGIDRASRGEAL